MLHAILLALQEIEEVTGLELELVIANPGGKEGLYYSEAKRMLEMGIKHVIGCYTSSSRKNILPLFEKYGGLLWYPAHYEGFECSDNIIYTGTSPNHHLFPLVDYVVSNIGKTAYCVGSDYIWAWESNRVFQEAFTSRGGSLLGIRYVAIDDKKIDFIINEILDLQPSFILNNLIGASNYHFFREFRRKCIEKGVSQAKRYPIVSCNLSEADLKEIGLGACDGHFSSSVYFSSINTQENNNFLKKYHNKFDADGLPTVGAESAYIATHMLCASLLEKNSDEPILIKKAALNFRMKAPQGEVYLDPLTFHAYLTPRIGLSTSEAAFKVIAQTDGSVKPNPFLVGCSNERMLLENNLELMKI